MGGAGVCGPWAPAVQLQRCPASWPELEVTFGSSCQPCLTVGKSPELLMLQLLKNVEGARADQYQVLNNNSKK